MGKYVPVTRKQTDAVCQMANEKKIGRGSFQEAMDNGSISRFLDGLLEQSETKVGKLSVPACLYEFRIHKDGVLAPALVERTKKTFLVLKYAEAMTNNKDEFVVGPAEDVVIRVFDAESLGVTGWSETDFFGTKGFEHVKKFGLTPCLSDDAFGLRGAYTDQKLDEWIRVVHPPISAGGYSRVFRVGHGRGFGRYVHGYDLFSFGRLRSVGLVALRVSSPKPLGT
ncbi:MAG: hypothetical protein EXS46_03840 [Candidatus Taylorbacteria bacterium]|nr:hypothetical protein [Candidatus Taylorbacteria bacterium]